MGYGLDQIDVTEYCILCVLCFCKTSKSAICSFSKTL